MKAIIQLFTVILLLSYPFIVTSQEENKEITKNESDTLKTYLIPGIEIIGEKKFNTFKYPGTAYTVNENTINLIQPVGTEEILKKLPGFNIASDDGISNRINVGMRGLYPRRSSRVLLMEDGVPVNPTLYLDPSTYYNSPSDRLDGMEIIKGSAGLKFGPLTMGGVINYLTNRPPMKPTLSLKLTGGTYGYYSAYGTYGGLWNNAGLELQALYKKFGGYRDNTSSDMYDITFKSMLEPSERITIGAKINYFNEDALSTYSGLTKYSFETDPTFNPKKYDELDAQRIAVDINSEFRINDNITLTTILYGNQYIRDWWRENDKFVKPDGSVVSSGYTGQVVRTGNGKNVGRLRQFRMAGLEPRLKVVHKMLGTNNIFEFGVRTHVESFQNKEVLGDTSFARSGSTDKDELFTAYAISTYLSNKIIFGKFSVIPGLRIENFKQQYKRFYNPVTKKSIDSLAENNNTEFLPGLSVNYSNEKINIFSGIHRGFTPPTLGTAFMNTSQVQDIAPGEENLEAEKSWNTEAGIRYKPFEELLIEATYFNMNISNMVDAGRDAIFRNLGKVEVQGVESAYSVDVTKLFRIKGFNVVLDGNYTFLRGRIKEAIVIERPIATSSARDTIDISGKVTPYTPEHTIQLGININLINNLDLRFDYKYVSEQFTDFRNTIEESEDGTVGQLASFSFMNASARYTLPKLRLTLHTTIKNIADKIYKGSRVSRTSSGIFPDGFRQIISGVEWNF